MKGSTRQGFVFVDVSPGREDYVIEHLIAMDFVKEVHLVTGTHDLLVLLDVKRGLVSDSSGEIVELVRGRIRKIRGVVDTETVISQERFDQEG